MNFDFESVHVCYFDIDLGMSSLSNKWNHFSSRIIFVAHFVTISPGITNGYTAKNKVLKVCTCYLRFLFERSFIALGHVHASYEYFYKAMAGKYEMYCSNGNDSN